MASPYISINLGKSFLRTSRPISYTNNSFDLNLGEGLCTFSSFHFLDSGLYLSNGFEFILIYFEWRDTDNQQLSCFFSWFDIR